MLSHPVSPHPCPQAPAPFGDATPGTALRAGDLAAPRDQLNWLRLLFRQCRAKARLDLFEACAMLATERNTAAQAFADALLRALEPALGRGVVLHRPGEPAQSFDERWLGAMLAAAQRDDADSMAFLLRSRLPRHARRQIGWLVTRLSETKEFARI